MGSLEVNVPDMGVDGEVEVIEICVAKGDQVESDAPLIVVESDKATVEVPAPQAGRVSRIALEVGAKVSQGDLILTLEAEQGSADESGDESEAEDSKEQSQEQKTDPVNDSVSQKQSKEKASEGGDEAQERDIEIPDLGGADQVEVIEVNVEPGQEIAQDDPLIVLESDKATMEVPAPAAGKVTELTVGVGDKVSTGDVIGKMLSSASGGKDSGSSEEEPSHATKPDSLDPDHIEFRPKQQVSESVTRTVETPGSEEIKVHAGPAVRKFARELGVELERVEASGPKNRILKEDLEQYIKRQVQMAQSGQVASGSSVPAMTLPDFSEFGEIDVAPMSKLHKLTAQNMQQSWSTIPHVTQFDEADITELEAFRKSHRADAEEKGLKLTPLPFLLKACAYALEALPQFNVSIDIAAHQVIQKKYIHIGIAVDTPNGLVVPVVKDVNRKSLWRLADECQVLATKARERKLSPADMKGGCFTISSLGGIGGTAFTPIVNAPEVAILGVSKAKYQPSYTPEGFVPRLMLPLSLSYDHRAVNGADAAKFTALLARVLGDLRELLL